MDYFGHELRAQSRTATEQGAGHILINSTELCSSVRAGGTAAEAWIEAIEYEFKHGDVAVQRKSSGAGFIGRYQLPRPASKTGQRRRHLPKAKQ
jgi:hypothetical protein